MGLEQSERPAVSAISVYEVLTGAGDGEQARTVELLAVFEIIPVTEAIAARAASLAQWQREQGAKPAIADTLIAATALALDKTLVTYDRQHFTRLGVTLYQDLPLLD
ncbi:MAG: PIN domain-containing protein [Armatimonadetes bacterium]|nr:PIN domain-containing protein [Armatimonadota bacterium]